MTYNKLTIISNNKRAPSCEVSLQNNENGGYLRHRHDCHWNHVDDYPIISCGTSSTGYLKRKSESKVADKIIFKRNWTRASKAQRRVRRVSHKEYGDERHSFICLLPRYCASHFLATTSLAFLYLVLFFKKLCVSKYLSVHFAQKYKQRALFYKKNLKLSIWLIAIVKHFLTHQLLNMALVIQNII